MRCLTADELRGLPRQDKHMNAAKQIAQYGLDKYD